MKTARRKNLIIIFVLIIFLLFSILSFYLLWNRVTNQKNTSNFATQTNSEVTPTPDTSTPSPTEDIDAITPTSSPTTSPIPTTSPKPTQAPVSSDCASSNKHAFTLNDFINLVQTAKGGDHISLMASVTGTMKINFPVNTSGKAICISYGSGVTSTGLLRFNDPQNVIMQNMKVTWQSGDLATEHMFKISGGSNWTLRNSEIYGAQSYANILITENSTNWKILKNYIHDVANITPVNSTVQNHNIYVGQANYGLIAGNRIKNAPRGRCIKIATASDTSPNQPHHITVTYNTFNNCIGPSLVGASYAASNNSFTKSIFINGPCVMSNNDLTGSGNSMNDNIYWNITEDCLVTHEGNMTITNMKKINPLLNSSDLPTNSSAASYGYGAYR